MLDDPMLSEYNALEAGGGDEGGIPMTEGEIVEKTWSFAHGGWCRFFSPLRRRTTLIKTNKRVAFSSKGVQPCCEKVVFEATQQSFMPGEVASVNVSKAPFCKRKFICTVCSLIAGIVFALVKSKAGLTKGGTLMSIVQIFMIIGFVCFALFLISFIVHWVTIAVDVTVNSKIGTTAPGCCPFGTDAVTFNITPATNGSFKLGDTDDIGAAILVGDVTGEQNLSARNSWKIQDKKGNSKELIVTDKRFIWRSFAKCCCCTLEDSMLMWSPDSIQSVEFNANPVWFEGFYQFFPSFILGIVLIIMGKNDPPAKAGGKGVTTVAPATAPSTHNVAFYIGIGVLVICTIVFIAALCGKKKDRIFFYLKSRASLSWLHGTECISTEVPCGKGPEAMALIIQTLVATTGKSSSSFKK